MKRKRRRKKIAQRKPWQHIVVYSLLGITILAVRILFPEIVDIAFNEVQTLSQRINTVAKDSTTALLTIAGLVYAWKALRRP